MHSSLQVFPAGILPGHRTMHGIRIPPSLVEYAHPAQGALLPPLSGGVPLSEVNSTSVLSSRSSLRSSAMISPTDQSISWTLSP